MFNKNRNFLLFITCSSILIHLHSLLKIESTITLNGDRVSRQKEDNISPKQGASLLTEPSSRNRIIFASCNRQDEYNPFWDFIVSRAPDIFIWMGDNVYADYTDEATDCLTKDLFLNILRPYNLIKDNLLKYYELREKPARGDRLEAAYHQLLNDPGYKKLKAMENLDIIGTWDDHDMGIDNANTYFKTKGESKEKFLDFLGESIVSPRRSESYEGIYFNHFYDFGFENRTINVVLLDCRWNFDPIKIPGSILGEKQWSWLKSTIQSYPAALTLIVSSIQILSEDRILVESWSRIGGERDRLYELILEGNVKAPLLLSGDVHYGELQGMKCIKRDKSSMRYLYEATSSGMTHSIATISNPIGWFARNFLTKWLPVSSTLLNPRDGRRMMTLKMNLGELEIIWNPLFDMSIDDIMANEASRDPLFEIISWVFLTVSKQNQDPSDSFTSPVNTIEETICPFYDFYHLDFITPEEKEKFYSLTNQYFPELMSSQICKMFTKQVTDLRSTIEYNHILNNRGWILINIYEDNSTNPYLQKLLSFSQLSTFELDNSTDPNIKSNEDKLESNTSPGWNCEPIHNSVNLLSSKIRIYLIVFTIYIICFLSLVIFLSTPVCLYSGLIILSYKYIKHHHNILSYLLTKIRSAFVLFLTKINQFRYRSYKL